MTSNDVPKSVSSDDAGDLSYSSGGASTSTGQCGGGSKTGTTAHTNSSSISEELARKESQDVCRLRCLVILVLAMTAAAVSVVIYLTTKKGEDEEFETQYEAATKKIMDSFADILTSLGSISGLGVALTAESVDYQHHWPFISLSNFQERAGNARHLSRSLFVATSPLVELEHFEEWDEYVSGESNQWM